MLCMHAEEAHTVFNELFWELFKGFSHAEKALGSYGMERELAHRSLAR